MSNKAKKQATKRQDVWRETVFMKAKSTENTLDRLKLHYILFMRVLTLVYERWITVIYSHGAAQASIKLYYILFMWVLTLMYERWIPVIYSRGAAEASIKLYVK